MPSRASATGKAPLTSASPPVLTSGNNSGVTKGPSLSRASLSHYFRHPEPKPTRSEAQWRDLFCCFGNKMTGPSDYAALGGFARDDGNAIATKSRPDRVQPEDIAAPGAEVDEEARVDQAVAVAVVDFAAHHVGQPELAAGQTG